MWFETTLRELELGERFLTKEMFVKDQAEPGFCLIKLDTRGTCQLPAGQIFRTVYEDGSTEDHMAYRGSISQFSLDMSVMIQVDEPADAVKHHLDAIQRSMEKLVDAFGSLAAAFVELGKELKAMQEADRDRILEEIMEASRRTGDQQHIDAVKGQVDKIRDDFDDRSVFPSQIDSESDSEHLVCSDCRGTGEYQGMSVVEECRKCHGTGRVL